jgi:predicted DsbA family dithiol-disulfide isomerase
LQKNYEIGLLWTAFPLHPETPEEGLTLEELFKDRGVDVKEVAARLKRVAAEAGLPWRGREKTYNSRLAQELGKWAETQGRGEEFHNAVFRAYFVEGINIAKIPELSALAKSVGLSESQARKILEDRTFKDAVDRDWARARALGIAAVPTFLFNERMLVGAQPYEVLEQFLIAGGVKRRI